MKALRKIAFAASFTAAISLLAGCTRSFHAWNSERVNDIREMYKVQDADNRLYNYQWFFEMYNNIKATANNAKLLDGDEKKGTLMVLNSMISEYNSKAAQERNAAKWKSAQLPQHIELGDVYSEQTTGW